MKKAIKVKGMHCQSCEVLIKDSLEEVDGVKSAELDHEKNIATVEYDETKVDENKIKKVIKDEGYEVE